MSIKLSRRRVLGGLAATLLSPPKALAFSLGSDITSSPMPYWATFGGKLIEEEQKRGFYRIFHDVRTDEKETLKAIAKTYGISVKNLVNQTGVELSKYLQDGQRLEFDVPVENFGTFIPYSFDENKNKVLKLTGDKLAQVRLHDFGVAYGHKRLAFLLGLFTKEYAANSQEYIPNLEQVFKISALECMRNDIDIFLPTAIAWQESGGRDWTISGTGAMGAFGLTSDNYTSGYRSDNQFRDSMNPFITQEASIVSIDYLKLLLDKKANGDTRKALALYHNGETVGINEQGLAYADAVLNKQQEIKTSPQFFNLRTKRHHI